MMTETLDQPVLSDAQAAVLGALLSQPGITAKQLAEIAGTAGSTTVKALVLLEDLGLAVRTAHGPADGKRVAATWEPTRTQAAAGELAQGAEQETDAESPEPPGNQDTGAGADEQQDVADEATSAEPTSATASFAADAGEREPSSGRLAAGGLRSLVIDLLASRPTDEFTPTSLGHLLNGRSAGAIANCLSTLVAQGQAERTSEKPRRYRHLAVDAV